MRTDEMGVTNVLVLPLIVNVDKVGVVVERKRAPEPGTEVGTARKEAGRRREARLMDRMVILGIVSKKRWFKETLRLLSQGAPKRTNKLKE